MYCKKCGAFIDDDAAFCEACGTKVEDETPKIEEEKAETPVENANETVVDDAKKEDENAEKSNEAKAPVAEKAAPQNPGVVTIKRKVLTPQEKKKRAKIIAIVVAVLVCAIAGIIALVTILNRVNVADYIAEDLIFSGYNGYGKIETEKYDIIDYDSLIDAVENKTDDDDDDSDFNDLLVEEYFEQYCDVEYLEKYDSLKNDDVVTVTITVDYDSLNNKKFANKKLHGKDVITKEYTVSGLKIPIEIDPFEAVNFVYYNENYGSYGTSYKYDYSKALNDGYLIKFDDANMRICKDSNENSFGAYGSSFSLECDERSDTKMDKVTLKVESYGEDLTADSFVDKYGVVFTSVSKEFEVESQKNITKGSEINADDLSALIEMTKSKYSPNEYQECELEKASSGEYSIYVVLKNSSGDYFSVEYGDMDFYANGRIDVSGLYGYESLTYDSIDTLIDTVFAYSNSTVTKLTITK